MFVTILVLVIFMSRVQTQLDDTAGEKVFFAQEPTFPDENNVTSGPFNKDDQPAGFLTGAFRTLGLGNNNDWYCDQPEHTMCIWEEGVFGPNCKFHSSVEATDPKEILQLHNKWRSLVAKGEEDRGSPGPQPPASNMRMMEWDDELAAIALRYAHQCQGGHDKMRNVKRFQVGQNVGMVNAKSTWIDPAETEFGKLDWDGVIRRLHEEVELFSKHHAKGLDRSLPESYRTAVGHYTQLIWAKTYLVGCAAVRWYQDSAKTRTDVIYVCNYGPSGNWEGAPLYEIGVACSACPEDFQECQDGLCTRQQASKQNETNTEVTKKPPKTEKPQISVKPQKPETPQKPKKQKFTPWRVNKHKKKQNPIKPKEEKALQLLSNAPNNTEESLEYPGPASDEGKMSKQPSTDYATISEVESPFSHKTTLLEIELDKLKNLKRPPVEDAKGPSESQVEPSDNGPETEQSQLVSQSVPQSLPQSVPQSVTQPVPVTQSVKNVTTKTKDKLVPWRINKSKPKKKAKKDTNYTSKRYPSKLKVQNIGQKIKKKLREIAKLTLEADKKNEKIKIQVVEIHNLLKKLL